MVNKEMRIGIIGAGKVAQTRHIPNYQKISGVKIAAVCDLSEERVRKVAQEFNVPETFTDYREMLRSCKLDAVSICVPPFLHHECAVESAEAGCHILCEKPIAISIKEAEEIIEAVEKAGTKFMLGFQRRFTKAAQLARDLIQEGFLGEVYYMKSRWLRRRGIPDPDFGLVKRDWFTQKEKSGGGCLIDSGIHFLDLALWITNNFEPVTVTASTYAKFLDREKCPHAEDLVTVFIKFKNGATLVCEVSWAVNADESVSISLMGDRAGIEFNPLGESEESSFLTIYQEIHGKVVDSKLYAGSNDPYEAEIKHFVDCIEYDKEPLCTKEESLVVMKIVDAIYKSSRTGKEVKLS